jgi:hypothetical protein
MSHLNLFLSGGCRQPGSSCKSTCTVASFARHVSKHPVIPPRKKGAVERRFRMCERVVRVVEMACIFTDCSTITNQQNKFALTISACSLLAELLL